jgi:ABC-2 type transport system ATP-binding protein
MSPDAYDIKRNIGIVMQNVAVFDELTVFENIDYFCGLYISDNKQRKMLVDEAIDFVALNDFRKFYPKKLSGGLLRRLNIACGISHKPKLIILDEPTGGLDPLIQQKFFEILRQENRKGVTIFFSSHVLSEVQKLCDRVAIIKEGKIIKIEKMKDINGDNYKRIKVETKDNLKSDYFKMPGVSDLKGKDNIYSFIYKGDINNVLKKVASINVDNIWIDEPDLEEIFLHYYNKEE